LVDKKKLNGIKKIRIVNKDILENNNNQSLIITKESYKKLQFFYQTKSYKKGRGSISYYSLFSHLNVNDILIFSELHKYIKITP
jgi:hypothetical protein